MKKIALLSLLLVFFSCQNQDWEYDDYEYSTVYFSYQYPIRILTMGEDLWDLTLDNAHKCEIYATWGGGYTTRQDVTLTVAVDNSLCQDLTFSAEDGENVGRAVTPMPSNYYRLVSNQILIPKGEISGGVEVEFMDEFFEDPKALKLNYVIPLVITDVQNADSILRGQTDLPNPRRCVADDWSVVPKDYVLYAIKYINTWDAYYLRRGIDIVTQNGTTETVSRRQAYVEDDEICKLNTLSLSETEFPWTYQDENGTDITISLGLTFEGDNCTIRSLTDGVTASGTGKFVKDGEKKSWGNKDRDALYLEYNIDLGEKQYSTKDTLVVQTRGVSKEEFSFTY